MPFTVQYVMKHYCALGKSPDKIHAGVADGSSSDISGASGIRMYRQRRNKA